MLIARDETPGGIPHGILEGETIHFEAEPAAVISRPGRRIPASQALDHVLGHTCAEDVSERAIQRAEMDQGALPVSKGFDPFCPLGPAIATGLDPAAVRLGARAKGEERPSSSTAAPPFPVAELIAWLSRAVTLLPGDVIVTGTPSGVGPILPGDTVEALAEGIGIPSNPVVAEP